jgi:hypothetical protein
MAMRMISTIRKIRKMVEEDYSVPDPYSRNIVRLTLQQLRRLRISVVKQRLSKPFGHRWAPNILPGKCSQRYSRMI